MTSNPVPVPMDRYQRATRAALALQKAHDVVAGVNELGELDGVLDHIARKVRLARETARSAAAESRR